MKRNLMKLTTIAALAAGMAMAQPPAAAPQTAPNASNPQARRFGGRHNMFQALNLTDQQKQQAKTIFQESRKSTQPVRQELRRTHESIAAAAKANDANAVLRLTKEQGRLRMNLMAARKDTRAKFLQILNPDQRAKAEHMFARAHARQESRLHRRING